MNNLGNIKFSSNDPFKSRGEFIEKKGADLRPNGRTIPKKWSSSHYIPRSFQSAGWTGTLRNADFISSLDMKHPGPRS